MDPLTEAEVQEHANANEVYEGKKDKLHTPRREGEHNAQANSRYPHSVGSDGRQRPLD